MKKVISVALVLSLSACAYSGPFSGDSGLNCDTDPAPCIGAALIGVAVLMAVAANDNNSSSSHGYPY